MALVRRFLATQHCDPTIVACGDADDPGDWCASMKMTPCAMLGSFDCGGLDLQRGLR